MPLYSFVAIKAYGAVGIAQWRTEGGFGVFKPPPPRNSDDIGGVLDRMSKKNRRLDFLLQFTVFSYGCNLLNKGFF